jgi:phage major head subunit gpT-like protein
MPANSQYPNITSKNVLGMFFQEMEIAADRSWVSAISNTFTSNQATETYAGLGTAPQMREWLGGKQGKNFREQSLTITNKDWESTLEVSLKDLRRDKTGQLQIRIGELAERAMAHDAKLISDLIENGTGTTLGACYDGLALFADTHSVGSSGTIDNELSVDISALPVATNGTTTDPSVGEFVHTVLAGVSLLQGFKDDQGEPINENAQQFVVMVPNGLSKVARLALSQQMIGSGENNPLIADTLNYRIVSNARLTWTDKFAVFRADGRAKPFITQLEVAPMLKALAEGSDYEFTNNAHLYSVEKSGNVGYGRFDQAALITMT